MNDGNLLSANILGSILFKMQKTSLNLEWSFQPILVWMRLIGVPLYRHHGNRLKLWLTTGFSATYFFLNMNASLIVFLGTVAVIASDTKAARKEFSVTVTWLWNYAIGRFNHSIINLGSHFALLAFTVIKWPSLMTNFDKLAGEKRAFLSTEDYNKIRIIFWRGFAIIILV